MEQHSLQGGVECIFTACYHGRTIHACDYIAVRSEGRCRCRKRALNGQSCSDLLMDEFLKGSWLAGGI